MNTLQPQRLTYLDQFRGYTVFGMIVVNYLGSYPRQIHPIFLHHNTYCSYADTIMPQFFFAVGFALRFTMVKRLQTEGWASAHLRVVRRVLGLLLIAALVHGFDKVNVSWEVLQQNGWLWWVKQTFSRNFFQTLTHIAVTTLWVLPIIGQRWPLRLLWLVGSAGLHLWCSQQFYLQFALDRPVIDGGPLGFLTWTIPVLAGSFASDLLTSRKTFHPVTQLLSIAILVMALGYGLSCLQYPEKAGEPQTLVEKQLVEVAAPPFMPPYHPTKPDATYAERHNINRKEVITLWTMSQQTGSISYLTFATGFSFLVLALCYLICSEQRQIGLFRTLGSNALIAYIVHGIAIDQVVQLYSRDAPLWLVLLGLAVVIYVTWIVCAWLEKRGWYIRV